MAGYASTLYTMEAANMFCGRAPADISHSLHLKLTTMKLPAIVEPFTDFRAAGAAGTVRISTGMLMPLECMFIIVGISHQVYELPLSWRAEDFAVLLLWCSARSCFRWGHQTIRCPAGQIERS